jgi:hypothetical protein
VALDADNFAFALKGAIGFSSIQTTPAEMLGFATAIIDEVKGAKFSHLVVSGTAPATGPLTLGTAMGGIIVGITPATLESRMIVQMNKTHTTTQLSGLATAIATELSKGLVGFAPGLIVGDCAAGAFTGKQSTNGIISGVSGTLMAIAASGYFGGVSDQLQDLCVQIAGYIMNHAVATYAIGAVTGGYPPPPAPGGPMTGVGANGTFS